jgi:hypothetical protein
MTALASTWGAGPAAIAAQRSIATTVAAIWRVDVLHTPAGIACVDAVFSHKHTLTAIAEIKARACSLGELRAMGSYLITFEKLQRARAIATALGIPFELLVGLRDDAIVWFRIAGGDGTWRVRYRVAPTTTAATCNGGRARRLNAFLDLADAHVLRGPRGVAS